MLNIIAPTIYWVITKSGTELYFTFSELEEYLKTNSENVSCKGKLI